MSRIRGVHTGEAVEHGRRAPPGLPGAGAAGGGLEAAGEVLVVPGLGLGWRGDVEHVQGPGHHHQAGPQQRTQQGPHPEARAIFCTTNMFEIKCTFTTFILWSRPLIATLAWSATDVILARFDHQLVHPTAKLQPKYKMFVC